MSALPRPNTYDVGDRVRVWGIFKTPAGVDTDPTTIVLKYQTPAGVETTKNYPADPIVKSSTGRYYFDIDVTASGTWYYKWSGTGAVVAAGEQSFIARATQF